MPDPAFPMKRFKVNCVAGDYDKKFSMWLLRKAEVLIEKLILWGFYVAVLQQCGRLWIPTIVI